MQSSARYGLYALAAVAGLAGYLLLDDTSMPGAETASALPPAEQLDLPPLTAVAGSDSPDVTRDLFNVVRPPAPPEPAPVVTTAPEPPASSPPPPDRLSQLKIIGVVSRGPQIAILIEVGDEVETVVAGQQFGQDSALQIDGLQDNRVLVTDKLANVTRTFTLSEE